PDTITREKLRAIREYGADRISVNPQTFSQKVLDAIGRRHTPGQTEEAFLAARDEGFKNINMDLIAGLPGDSADSFAASLNKALSLSPESVTVHTLALKRSARLVTGEDGQDPPAFSCPAAECAKMVGHALTTLPAAGYPPYYMYRQSRSVGNLENTGFAKKGYECVYNIVMMEETHTVIGAGAGAVTRLTDGEGDIKRICNHKYPFEYIGRFDGDGKNAGIREFYSRRAASEETE
ncbi:MAG: radical SAM protein, partial [Clostridia bacterium]|nr:radical SAM protein [Clostridia bacterium]